MEKNEKGDKASFPFERAALIREVHNLKSADFAANPVLHVFSISLNFKRV